MKVQLVVTRDHDILGVSCIVTSWLLSVVIEHGALILGLQVLESRKLMSPVRQKQAQAACLMHTQKRKRSVGWFSMKSHVQCSLIIVLCPEDVDVEQE